MKERVRKGPPLPWGGSKHKNRNTESRDTHTSGNYRKQNTGTPTTYQTAGVTRAQGDTDRSSLTQVNGVSLLVPVR